MTIISYAKSPVQRAMESMRGMDSLLATAGNPYSLTLINQSAMSWTFYVYQQMPNQQSANVFSVAWFCSPFIIMPGNQITFQWSIDYTFVWGATGQLVPGVTFNASGVQQANVVSANTTIFTTSPGPNLSIPVVGQPQGSLVISDTAIVPANVYSVGIGMGSAGTFVTPAGPNLTHTFTPTPTYWIAAGTSVQIGTVLNINTITQNAQVIFPLNIYAQTWTLGASNQWSQTA